ncbi:MAG: histidine--tRNA ligase [Acidimicrobiales bacterium]
MSKNEPRSQAFRTPKGTQDILPPESHRWQRFVALYARQACLAGFGLHQPPMFEDSGVFRRVGEGTDVVTKEMYEFEDRSGRSLALRPEGTASVCRAFVQHRPTVPFKVWYCAPSFRYEKSQAGRFRQHHQLGAETLGSSDPDVDVEIIALAWRVLRDTGLKRMLLLLNTMGDAETRLQYTALLREFLLSRMSDLDEADRAKVETHPLRVLDSKSPSARYVIEDAPKIVDMLRMGARSHFERVQEGLGALDIPFALEPRLVRGLDYYTHTTFEIQSAALESAQSTLCGGGRYDGLVEALGGPPTPGIGFGMGIERVLLACDAEAVFGLDGSLLDVWVVDVAGGRNARDLTHELRSAGIAADRSFDHRSMRSQMKAADRSGAGLALIVGDDEADLGQVTLRHLRRNVDQQVIARGDVVAKLLELLAEEEVQLNRPSAQSPYEWLGGQE